MSEFVFHEFAPLLPAKLLERAAKLSPAQLCDGMKGLGIPCDGCAPAEILPVARGMKVLGTAYTIRSAGGNNFPVHVALYDPRVTPGYVIPARRPMAAQTASSARTPLSSAAPRQTPIVRS